MARTWFFGQSDSIQGFLYNQFHMEPGIVLRELNWNQTEHNMMDLFENQYYYTLIFMWENAEQPPIGNHSM